MLLPALLAVSFWLVDHLGHVWFLPQALSGSQTRHLLEKSAPHLSGGDWTEPVISCALLHPQARPQSIGVTLDPFVSERDLESLALSGPEGSIQGAMMSAESILAERMSYFC